ncbi:S8/S53 family peptidase [Oligoflexus tunisiensis]|uniref:S8/S53 family peptidase n=1 Tax=Oligoflexus tunisiensis TaxID=708132 RepID=UPI000A84EF36|nr:S8/S53 family peptidase [Oligoflexus tunisiensis]
MKTLIRLSLILLNMLLMPVLWAGEAAWFEALQGLERINGFEADPEIKALIPAYQALPAEPDQAVIQTLFEDQNLAQWSTRLDEYLSLSAILFEGLSPTEQKSLRPEFDRCREALRDFQKAITDYVLRLHPGFAGLGLAPLQAQWKGQGIRIVVFDVFENARIEEQRRLHPKARIAEPLIFGRPVELSHGNTVIDIILQLAPEAHIIPVAADGKSYSAAMQHLADRNDVDIINMSRAFPEDPVTKKVETAFKDSLRRWTRTGLFVKSLGNTGTDLFGTLTSRRVEKGLGPVATLTSYDLKLIREMYQEAEPIGLEVLALNLALFAQDLALTATIPGAVIPVQERTLAVPAEGLFSPSTGTFESGSSFAAPQITAWLALHLEQRRALYPDESRAASRRAVYQETLQKADREGHPASEWGRGRPVP